MGDLPAGEEATGELVSPANDPSLAELDNEKLASWGHRREPGLRGGGRPRGAVQAFYLLKGKRDLVLKTSPLVCSHEQRRLLKAAGTRCLRFKREHVSVCLQTGPALERAPEPSGDGETGWILKHAAPSGRRPGARCASEKPGS